MDIGEVNRKTGYINILLQKNEQFHSLVDVGFGTSQVLPIVFELMANKNRLILIEQPELHLHPSAQAEIAELFLDSIKNKNQLVVETHSATLIERIRRLIRNGTFDPEDATIIYIQEGGSKTDGSVCKQIGFLKMVISTLLGQKKISLVNGKQRHYQIGGSQCQEQSSHYQANASRIPVLFLWI